MRGTKTRNNGSNQPAMFFLSILTGLRGNRRARGIKATALKAMSAYSKEFYLCSRLPMKATKIAR